MCSFKKRKSERQVRLAADFDEKSEGSDYNGIISSKCPEKIMVNLGIFR